MSPLAVVFGGAGFIGASICHALAGHGWRVRAVDGVLPRTSANLPFLESRGHVELARCVVDEAPGALAALIDGADLVVDAMGWTKHLEAIQDPAYDLRLNVGSHLPVIRALADAAAHPRLVVHLGSRHQYGRPQTAILNEDAPQTPVDVQGIHKIAAEQHWRFFADADKRFPVASIRFGNSFGPGQPIGEGDIGLIGGFFRTALSGETIRVFGTDRRRNIVYAPDIGEAIHRLSLAAFAPGFVALNLSGRDLTIRDLATAIITACGSGDLVEEDLPANIARIDIGEAILDDSRLRSLIGRVPMQDLTTAMTATAKDLASRLAR